MVVTRRLPFSLDKVTEFGHGHFHGFIGRFADLLTELGVQGIRAAHPLLFSGRPGQVCSA